MSSLSSVLAWYSSKQPGSDARQAFVVRDPAKLELLVLFGLFWGCRSRLIIFILGSALPWIGPLLQLLRIFVFAPRENTPTNTIFVSDVITAIFIVLGCALPYPP